MHPAHNGVVSSSNRLVTDDLPRCGVCVSFVVGGEGNRARRRRGAQLGLRRVGSSILCTGLSAVYGKLRRVFPSGDTTFFGRRVGGKEGGRDHD